VFVVSPSEPKEGEEPQRARGMRGSGRSHPGGGDILLLCISAKDGSVLWQHKLGSGNKLYGKHNMASPSPVTDGSHVWALTGTGLLAAFDMQGKEAWRRDLAADYGEPNPAWGYGSSPLLYDGKVIVPVMHGSNTRTPSYVVAFDAETGGTIWHKQRKTDAEKECPDAYTTPVLSTHHGRTELIISGADYVTAHDPATGEEVWRSGGLNPEKRGNYRVVASPVAVNGMIYAPTRVRPLLAIRAGGKGDVTESHRAWSYTDAGAPDVPTPVCDGKHLYLVADNGLVTCLDAASGETVWGPERTATGTVSASAVLAEGRLYVTNEQATTTVLKAGPQFEVLATNDLNDGYTISSPAIVNGRIYLRTSTHLVCIGE
jgi:outer membrane protein assembly factor BamB